MKTFLQAILFIPGLIIGFILECAQPGLRAGREIAAKE